MTCNGMLLEEVGHFSPFGCLNHWRILWWSAKYSIPWHLSMF